MYFYAIARKIINLSFLNKYLSELIIKDFYLLSFVCSIVEEYSTRLVCLVNASAEDITAYCPCLELRKLLHDGCFEIVI